MEKRLLTNRQLPVSCKNNKFNFRIVERNEMKWARRRRRKCLKITAERSWKYNEIKTKRLKNGLKKTVFNNQKCKFSPNSIFIVVFKENRWNLETQRKAFYSWYSRALPEPRTVRYYAMSVSRISLKNWYRDIISCFLGKCRQRPTIEKSKGDITKNYS